MSIQYPLGVKGVGGGTHNKKAWQTTSSNMKNEKGWMRLCAIGSSRLAPNGQNLIAIPQEEDKKGIARSVSRKAAVGQSRVLDN